MPAKSTFLYFPTFGALPLQHETNLTTTFAFGISTHRIELPDTSTSRGTHFRSFQPLTDQEAAGRLIAKLREKAADAPTMPPLMLSTLTAGLASLLASRAPILGLPDVMPALQATIGVVDAVMKAASAAPTVEEAPDGPSAYGIRPQVAALTAQVATQARVLAALEARLATLEAQAA